MTYLAFVGSFNIDTTKTAGQTQQIASVGFQPKIVMFWWSGSTATVDSVTGAYFSHGFGVAISDASRWVIGGFSLDAQATSSAQRFAYTNSCICIYDSAGSLDGIMDFSSMDADGFTLIVDNQFTNACRISYLALGGTDLTNVLLGSGTLPISTGVWSVGSIGFQPDALIMCTIGNATNNATAGSGGFVLGMATSSSAQGTVLAHYRNLQATSDTYGYGYNGEVLSSAGSGAMGIRNAFVSFGADGFTLNDLEGTAAFYYYYIVLKGGQYLVGDLTTRTDGNDIAETVGFQPVALLFASANRALSTQDTLTANARLSIGAGTSTSARAVQAISDEDNLADTETAYANYDTAVYAHVKDDGIEALMDIKSIFPTGFTCVMDDTETAGCWVTYLAIGATSGNVNPLYGKLAQKMRGKL